MSARRRSGFTLIELLVAVAIVGLLIGLLVPSLAGARSVAAGVECQSNLRQLAVGATAYTIDFEGRYPLAHRREFVDGFAVTHEWDFVTRGSASEARVELGMVWRYVDGSAIDVGRVQQCPVFEGASNTLADPYTGYNYNTSYIGRGAGEVTPDELAMGVSVGPPARIGDVRSPSQTALFGDGEWEGGANKFMRSPRASPSEGSFFGRSAGTQGYRHRDATHVAWCDGSVVRWLERSAELDWWEGEVAPGTGFLASTNERYDLR